MKDIFYLHGFGTTNADRCPVAIALRTVVSGNRIQAPCYHPEGQVEATQIGRSLDEFTSIIENSTSGKVHLVGYSFGGLLASLLAEKRPDIIENVLLLAPAIDNFERNYAGRDPASWRMPRTYVEELQAYPARPAIVRPTILVHGMLDDDRGGSAPWRIERWQAEQPFRSVYLLAGVNHALEPWLASTSLGHDRSSVVPMLGYLLGELLSAAD